MTGPLAPLMVPSATPMASALSPASPGVPKGVTDSAARQFEAVFLGQLVQAMFETVPADSAFSGGHAETMFRSILAEHFGQEMASRGGLGLAPAVSQTLLDMQKGRP